MSTPPESVLVDVVTPAAVAVIAAGRPLRPVWRNVLGGLTFEILGPPPRSFVKFAPAGTNLPLAQEAERLRWAARYTPVPEVIGTGSDETGTWLHTVAIPGRSAVHPYFTENPAEAVIAIAEGLHSLHNRIPVEECPFDWSVERRLANHDTGPGPDEALRRAAETPDIDRLVVCHGDPCAPNTLVDDDGRWAGHVDLAAIGVADRWADLAVASWSLNWNYGDGWEELFFDTYGIDPDPVRIAYYRLLWDLGG